jgi:predicted small secreted protein
MRRTRRILLIVVAVAVLLATIHFTVNGFPALSSLNPHAR